MPKVTFHHGMSANPVDGGIYFDPITQAIKLRLNNATETYGDGRLKLYRHDVTLIDSSDIQWSIIIISTLSTQFTPSTLKGNVISVMGGSDVNDLYVPSGLIFGEYNSYITYVDDNEMVYAITANINSIISDAITEL